MTDEHHHSHPLEDEDKFTPRGRHWLEAVVAIVGLLVLVSVWISWQRIGSADDDKLAASGAEIPSTCSTDMQSTWYGSNTGYVLNCAADLHDGNRYRISLRCGFDGTAKIALGFFDGDGTPRAPQWVGGGNPPTLPVSLGPLGSPPTPATLMQRSANRGELQAVTGDTLLHLLGSHGIVLSGAFPDETATFDLDAGRWYVDYFLSSCKFAPAQRATTPDPAP